MGRVLILAVLSLLLADAVAETPEEKGLAIAVEADRRDLGWNDSTSSLTMLLRNRQGDESLRFIRVRKMKEQEQDGDDRIAVDAHGVLDTGRRGRQGGTLRGGSRPRRYGRLRARSSKRGRPNPSGGQTVTSHQPLNMPILVASAFHFGKTVSK